MPGVVSPSLISRAELIQMQDAIAQMPRFIASEILTVDNLLVTYPANKARRGMYARVSDYGGYVDRVLRCDYFADLDYHQWVPVLAEYGRAIPLIGDMTLLPLKSPTSVVFTGTLPLGVTRSVTLSTTNGRPGEVKEIKAGLTSLLGTLNIWQRAWQHRQPRAGRVPKVRVGQLRRRARMVAHALDAIPRTPSRLRNCWN